MADGPSLDGTVHRRLDFHTPPPGGWGERRRPIGAIMLNPMPVSSPTPPRRRKASAGFALALYLASAVAAPLAHARTEVLSSRPEVEAQHTKLCARIHTEATCLVCSTVQLPSPLPRALAPDAPQRPRGIAYAREVLIVRREASSRHLVRAPPAR